MIITTKSSMDMNTGVESKSSILTNTLVNIFKADRINLARFKFINSLIIVLSKIQTAGFEKLATAFEGMATTVSSLRRIQRFIAKYALAKALNNNDLIQFDDYVKFLSCTSIS